MDVLKNLVAQTIHSTYQILSHLFPVFKRKRDWKRRKYSNDSKVETAAEQYFNDQTLESFLEGLKKHKQCIELWDEYIEEHICYMALVPFFLGWTENLTTFSYKYV